MLLILQKENAKAFFSDVTKLQNAGLPMVRSQSIKSIFANKGNTETKFGAPLLPKVALIFLNKTDVEQYRFRYFCQMGL